MTIQVYEADNYLSKLLIYVNKGEEVVITQNGKPVARLIPAEKKTKKRVPGSAEGQIIIMPDFDDPLPEDILQSFES